MKLLGISGAGKRFLLKCIIAGAVKILKEAQCCTFVAHIGVTVRNIGLGADTIAGLFDRKD